MVSKMHLKLGIAFHCNVAYSSVSMFTSFAFHVNAVQKFSLALHSSYCISY